MRYARPLLGRTDLWRVLSPVVVLLALTAGARAGRPAPKPAPPPPLFNPLVPQPQSLAALAVGGAAGTGPLVPLSTLYAGEHPDLNVWSLQGVMSTRNGRTLVGAATLLLTGSSNTPAGLFAPALGLLRAGEVQRCWTLIDTSVARRIPKRLLSWIEDNKAIAVGAWEAVAYSRILSMAHYTEDRAFIRAARDDLTLGHLMNEPAKYRGQVVPFEGRVRRLRRYDPPPEAAAEGVNDLYEAWIFSELYGPRPFCVVFTNKPAGLKLGEKTDQRVKGAGYFYKRYRYTAGVDGQGQTREAPLLIAHTVTLLPGGEPPPSTTDWVRDLLPVFLGLVAATVGVVFALAWWFRRSDRRIRQRLLTARGESFVDPSANGQAGPPSGVPERPAATGEEFTGLDQ